MMAAGAGPGRWGPRPRSGMARARRADLAGDRSACEQALADVGRAIGP